MMFIISPKCASFLKNNENIEKNDKNIKTVDLNLHDRRSLKERWMNAIKTSIWVKNTLEDILPFTKRIRFGKLAKLFR
jgi:hypothetical protein